MYSKIHKKSSAFHNFDNMQSVKLTFVTAEQKRMDRPCVRTQISTFQELRETIKLYHSSEKFQVSYKDDDGDTCAILDDRAWKHAKVDGCLKLFIQIEKSLDKAPCQEKKQNDFENLVALDKQLGLLEAQLLEAEEVLKIRHPKIVADLFQIKEEKARKIIDFFNDVLPKCYEGQWVWIHPQSKNGNTVISKFITAQIQSFSLEKNQHYRVTFNNKEVGDPSHLYSNYNHDKLGKVYWIPSVDNSLALSQKLWSSLSVLKGQKVEFDRTGK